MSVSAIDGVILGQMLECGLDSLYRREEELNRLNVFPVPDGDTGTNMRLTLQYGIKAAKETENLGEYLSSLAEGMLLGARGNSGVILSQIFKGISGLAQKTAH